MSLQPQLSGEDGKPVVVISKRIIMPLEGFVQSLAIQEDIVTYINPTLMQSLIGWGCQYSNLIDKVRHKLQNYP
ncbi:hypothetical protein [Sporomusa sp.]|uniref:hypothetical protein n=1 Tax=Sporomusa sp. TaxID=2078658 RepID=UPI002BF48920|nr:hypothetical protein [Sporomusa sp.]HWR07638.1 hypothetical protein [Sporomusa sp.]